MRTSPHENYVQTSSTRRSNTSTVYNIYITRINKQTQVRLSHARRATFSHHTLT